MGKRMVSTSVYMTEEQNAALRILSRMTRVPLSQFIRDGIEFILEKHKDLIGKARENAEGGDDRGGGDGDGHAPGR